MKPVVSNKRVVLIRMLLSGLTVTSFSMARAEVSLPAIFGDNMVLQQGIVAPIWGKARPGEKVTISVDDQNVSVTTDSTGKWKVALQPLKMQDTPLTVVVTGDNTLTLRNVLVGEVWVGSGQSNMQYTLGGVRDGQKEADAANYPSLRLFTVKPVAWRAPLEDMQGAWTECTPKTAKEFSATLYFFGRDLQKGIQQPVGLINSSWGATIIQSWTRWEVLMTDPDTKKEVEARIKQLEDPEWLIKNYEEETVKRAAAAEKESIVKGMKVLPMRADWLGDGYRNRPSSLYNAMVHPLLGFPIRGVVWYQGEFNAGNAVQYERLFPKMIADWRTQWGQGDFPFLFVQLPNNGPTIQTEPPKAKFDDAKWASLREAQLKTLKVPGTAMAVTIDTSDGELHPKNKQPVGDRLARLALHEVYKMDIPCFGPMFEKMTTTGNEVTLQFQHATGGLVAKNGGLLKGFAVAGADKKFVWADARIEGETVVLSSPQVPLPVAVRYGWDNNPLVSLYNQAGLPASPFRTDDWKE